MTLIQPNKDKNIFSILLMLSVVPLLTGVVWLIMIYNQTVNFNHSATSMKEELANVQTESADLKEKLFATLDTDNLQQVAADYQLVKDKNPQFLEIDTASQWAFASQH